MQNRGLPSEDSTQGDRPWKPIPASVRIAGIYLLAGMLWIFLSDRLINLISHERSEALTQLQTVKGWFYVIATSAMLGWLVERESRANRRTNRRLKQALDELWQSEERFRVMVENAPDIIVRFDRALRHLYVNPAIEPITGRSSQDFIGKTNRELGMPEAQVALWDAAFSQVFATGQPAYLEFDFPTPKGLRDFQAHCVPEWTAEGAIASVLVVARDITEQKRLERVLRDRLAQEQAALAEKDVLLKEIHHRVKNNLQIVAGLLQLQADSLQAGPVVHALRESQNRIESMSLIHKKLYASSDLGHIDAADYIQSLTISLLTTYQISPGAVVLNVDVDPVILNLDQAIPCGLIINELVSNALKYAFPNNPSGEINVKLCQVDRQLELTIHDNGIGFPRDFDWQATPSLGLSLVQALATDQLDGSLSVDHTNGSGFTVTFPYSSPGNLRP